MAGCQAPESGDFERLASSEAPPSSNPMVLSQKLPFGTGVPAGADPAGGAPWVVSACGGQVPGYFDFGNAFDVDLRADEYSPNTRFTFNTETWQGEELLRFATHLQLNLIDPNRRVLEVRVKACTHEGEGVVAVEAHRTNPYTGLDWELDTIGYRVRNCAEASVADSWIVIDMRMWGEFSRVSHLCTATLNLAGHKGEVTAVQLLLTPMNG